MHHLSNTPTNETLRTPPAFTADGRAEATAPGEVSAELDLIGVDNRRLVLLLTGTVTEVRADLAALMSAARTADARLDDLQPRAAYRIAGTAVAR